ncbi:MAG: GAF domain-containing protein [Balneola sp.]
MKLLLHAIEGINRTMELKQLLLKCMESVCTVVEAEASSLMLLDNSTGRLHLSVPTGPVKDEIKGQIIPRDKGVAGWVLKNKKPYLENDMKKSKEFFGDISEGFTTKNLICVPLFDSQQEVIGVAQALNKKEGREFTEKDISVFETLASHVALSIEKAKEVDELRNTIKDKEARLKEIHKGFENSLSALNALVQLQVPMLSDENAKFMMKATGSRIETIAHAHEVLFNSEEQETVDLGFYLGHLTSTIVEIFGDYEKEISYSLDIDKVGLKASIALTVGLIINEVILNMYREAFIGQEKGRISIAVKKDGGDKVLISISDNGNGVSEFLDGTAPDNLASIIIQTLGDKLNADSRQHVNGEGGTTFTMIFSRDVSKKKYL